MLPEAVTPEDVIAACGGAAVEPEPALPEYQRIPPAPEKEAQTMKKKLPVWRKVLAAVSGIASLALIVQAIGVTDLTKLVDAGGLTNLAGDQLKLYGILLLSLLVFALSIGRKADRPDYLIQTPVEKHRRSFATVLSCFPDAVHRRVLFRRESTISFRCSFCSNVCCRSSSSSRAANRRRGNWC